MSESKDDNNELNAEAKKFHGVLINEDDEDDKSFDSLVRKKLHEMDMNNEKYIDFNGNETCFDYHDHCDGWDGRNDRCQCGNRRVMWVESDGEVYAHAY